MKNNEQNRDNLQEAYEDSLFALLMDQHATEEGQRLMDESRKLEEAEYMLPEGTDARIHRVVEDVFKSQNRAKAAKSALKGLSRAAVILLVCGVVFATLFVSVSAFRETVTRFIMQVNSVNTNTRVGESDEILNDAQAMDGDRIHVPSGAYVPAWLPDGYILKSYTAGAWERVAIYSNADNELITYFEYINRQVLAVDTEKADTVEDVRVNEFDGILCIKGDTISISWIDGTREVLARIKTTNLDKETALKIAKSVKGS